VRPSFAQTERWKIGLFQRPTNSLGTYAQLGSTVKRSVLCEGPHTAETSHWPGDAHVVVITGWDDTWGSGTGAWIVKNSWGANWIAGGDLGNAGPGYAFVPYNSAPGDLVNYTFYVRNVKVVP